MIMENSLYNNGLSILTVSEKYINVTRTAKFRTVIIYAQHEYTEYSNSRDNTVINSWTIKPLEKLNLYIHTQFTVHYKSDYPFRKRDRSHAFDNVGTKSSLLQDHSELARNRLRKTKQRWKFSGHLNIYSHNSAALS